MRPWFRRRPRVPGCPGCGHPWDEHAGGGADDDLTQVDCGECQYEVEHGFLAADATLCQRRAYDSRVQELLARAHANLVLSGSSPGWVSPSPQWRTARVEVDLPDGRAAVLMEDSDSVYLSIGGRAELLLDDGQELELTADPWDFLVALAGPGTAGNRRDKRFVVAGLRGKHAKAPFPASLRGEEVAGVDAVMADADIIGCVDTWLLNQGVLSLEQQRSLPGLLVDVSALEAALRDPDEIAYYRRLHQMGSAILLQGP